MTFNLEKLIGSREHSRGLPLNLDDIEAPHLVWASGIASFNNHSYRSVLTVSSELSLAILGSRDSPPPLLTSHPPLFLLL